MKSPSATYLLASIVGKAGSFLLIPLYTRRLSADGYGALGLVSSLLALVPLVLSLGLTAGFSRTYFETPDRAEGLRRVGSVAKGMVVLAGGLGAVVVGALVVFLPAGMSGLSLEQLVLIVLAGFSSCLAIVPDVIWRAQLLARRAAAFQLLQLGLTISLSLLFVVVLDRGLDGAIEAIALAALPPGAIGAWFIWARLGGTNVAASTRAVLLFSLPFVPHFLGSWAQDSGDRWVVKALAGENLGPYYLALQLLAPISLAVSAWNSSENARMGEVFRASGLTGLRSELAQRYRRFLAVAAVASLAVAVAGPLVVLVVGKGFDSTLWFLPLLVMAQVIDAAYYPSSNFIFYSGRSALIPVTTLVSAVISVSLAAGLTWAYGIWGLLVARVASSLFRTLLLGAVCRRLSVMAEGR